MLHIPNFLCMTISLGKSLCHHVIRELYSGGATGHFEREKIIIIIIIQD
jgi:hypothetical protein